MEGVTLVDWDGVTDTIASIKHDTCGTARAAEGQHGLISDKEGWDREGLEHDLDHLLTVLLPLHHHPVTTRGTRDLAKEDWVLSWVDRELVVEHVVPDLLHIVPVGDETALNWVVQDEDTGLVASLITDIGILVAKSDSVGVLVAADDGWEPASSPAKPAFIILEPLSITRVRTLSDIGTK